MYLSNAGGRCQMAVGVILCAFFIIACSPTGSLQHMAEQPKYKPLDPSDFSPDQLSARQPVSDTVASGQLRDDTLLFTGEVNGKPAEVFPFAITRDVLERGQERFNIFCAPCHGRVGDGNGIVVQRGFPHAASFHTDGLRTAPVGHFFGVITNGFGPMPSYADQIPARDRWAIIAYIRALQLSQHAALDNVPPDQRNNLGTGTPQP